MVKPFCVLVRVLLPFVCGQFPNTGQPRLRIRINGMLCEGNFLTAPWVTERTGGGGGFKKGEKGQNETTKKLFGAGWPALTGLMVYSIVIEKCSLKLSVNGAISPEV